jgi:hypothetical protein
MELDAGRDLADRDFDASVARVPEQQDLVVSAPPAGELFGW